MNNVQVSVTQLDAVGRITLPLATGPRHVHCYLVDGTLFDTGIGLDPPPWRDLGIERIAITHFHPDHVGGAEAAAAESGAPVYQGGLDYAQCERVWGSTDWPERIADWFATASPRRFARSSVSPFIRSDWLVQGSEMDGWTVLRLPGRRPPGLPRPASGARSRERGYPLGHARRCQSGPASRACVGPGERSGTRQGARGVISTTGELDNDNGHCADRTASVCRRLRP
jgi:hypothetical protein